ATEAAELSTVVGTVEEEHRRAATALDEARAAAATKHTELERARTAYADAQTADRAAALRPHLVQGEPCPVCTQPVVTLPEPAHGSAVAAAQRAGEAARQAADAADAAVAKQDAVVRDLDRALVAARTRAEHHARRLSELDGQLAGAPDASAIERELKAIAAVAHAEQSAAEVWNRIAALFESAGLPPPAGADDPARAAAVEAERADAALRRIEERRAQAAELRGTRAGYERDGQVAKALA